jgi:hypothetical protein
MDPGQLASSFSNSFVSARRCEGWVNISLFHRYYTLYYVLATAGQLLPKCP